MCWRWILEAKVEGSRVQLMAAMVSKREVSSLALVVAEQWADV